MKSHSAPFVVLIAALLVSALPIQAEESSYTEVVKERDSVLSQILTEREGRRPTGMADEAAIASARLALYAFRRDVATTTGEKIRNQEQIVQVFELKLAHAQSVMSAGLGETLSVLEAKAPLLEAKQLLAELRLKVKHG